MKPVIHYHSDCPFFAGCENMLVNFFTDSEVSDSFAITFSYRYSPEYDRGFRARVPNFCNATALALPDLDAHLHRIRFRPLRIVLRLLAEAAFLKYLYLFICRKRLERFFQSRRIDLLHVNNGGFPGAPSCNAAVRAARKVGINRIVYVVNNIAAPRRVFGRWFEWFVDARVKADVSMFVTGSRFAAERLREVLGLPVEQVVNIPNGIRLRDLTESREDVFSRLGLDPDRLLFIVVAVLERRKGHGVLLQALAEMLGTPMEFHIPQIIIEGDGSCWQELVTFVKRNNLQSYVRFIGPEKNVFNLLNASDALVLPSRSHEDFPNVILEAMALGKPVIATRLAGIPEQVEQLVTGLIVEPGDARALGEAIVSLSRDSTLRKEMGKAARERFDREFVAAVAVRRYQELYSILTAKGPR